MAWERRVVWSEGMMLQPHHFQQQTRYHESQLRSTARLSQPYAWGLYSIAIDKSHLKTGKIALNSCEGVLPDGNVFRIPELDEQPKALDVSDDHLDTVVYLAVSIRRHNNTETIREGQVQGRYKVTEHQTRDVSGVSNSEVPIEVSGLNFSLRTDKDDNSEFSCIPIARVEDVSINGVVTLKEDFIPPCLNVKCNPFLTGFISELVKLCRHRIQSLASRVSVAGKATGSEVAEYLMLQTLNRHYPMLQHLDKAEHITPYDLYDKMVTLVGDMSTFIQPDKLVPDLPHYDHRQPSLMFVTLISELRQMFSVVLEQNSINIPLQEKKFGIRVGTISDKTLFTSASFILAVSADISADDIRKYFPPQVKIGAVEQIKELVNVQLPGIQLTHLAAAPREMPYQRNFVYFELVQNGEYWQSLTESGGIACHIGTNFPNLSMELWAIRSH
jgi:type VI secretion system protein ImpJ